MRLRMLHRNSLVLLVSAALFAFATCRGGGIGSGLLGLEDYKRDAEYYLVRGVERGGRTDTEARVAGFYNKFLAAHLQARVDGLLRSGQGAKANALFRVARGNHSDACLRNAKRLSIEALTYGMYNVKTLDLLAKKEAAAIEP